MSTKDDIKQKLLQLDAASFQNLCDSYLYRSHNLNFVSLGGKPGTRKTTNGTPDTYYTYKDEYIFIEYTTQVKDLYKKIIVDLNKCLNEEETHIPCNKIKKIIYAHLSSNLTPQQDSSLKSICNKKGIPLILIGIDKLAEDLYQKYQSLAKDYLNLPIDTCQIMELPEFIKDYNSKGFSTPIDTEFMFRDEELKKIDEAFKESDIVILTGPAGCGKTRLALYYAEKYQKDNNSKLLCISNKSLPIYDDLCSYFSSPGDYFLVIDDANQITQLTNIIEYTNKQEKGFNVKILITVRNYALIDVSKKIATINCCKEIVINTFADNQISEFVKKSLGIKNPLYLDRINFIAKGNARIAYLAGKIAADTNRLDSINDLSQLYDNYYGGLFEKDNLWLDPNLFLVAGIVAYFNTLQLDNLDAISELLIKYNINKRDFVNHVYKLSEMEIVDIYINKVAQFNDESFSNYVFKYVFYDKNLLSLSNMVYTYFHHSEENTNYVVNTLLNIFNNKNLENYVKQEINAVWDKFERENVSFFLDFLESYGLMYPTRTLAFLYAKQKALKEHSTNNSENNKEDKETEAKEIRNYLEILKYFSDTAELNTALDIFFDFYFLRPDLLPNFSQICTQYYGITKYSLRNNYYTLNLLLNKIVIISDNWKVEKVIELFLNIVPKYLQIKYTTTENAQNYQFLITNFTLSLDSGVKLYRKLIWESLIEISSNSQYHNKIREIIDNYEGRYADDYLDLVKFDLPYIKTIFEKYLPSIDLANSLVIYKFSNIFKLENLQYNDFVSQYLTSEKFKIYLLLRGPEYKDCDNRIEKNNLKEQQINNYIKNAKIEKLQLIIDFCCEYETIKYTHEYEIISGLELVFKTISKDKEIYCKVVEYYLEKNTPINFYLNNIYEIIDKLFSLLSENEVYNLLNKYNYKQKNRWIYAYYHELPKSFIIQKHLTNLYLFLADDSDKQYSESFHRDVFFLEKYSFLDSNAFLEGCKIIFEKKTYSRYIVFIYFESLFPYFRSCLNK